MSVLAMSWAFSLEGLTPAEKLVLLALADNADDKGVCWPSIDLIARKSSTSRRTVQTHLKTLEHYHLITRTRRSSLAGRKSTLFKLAIGSSVEILAETRQSANLALCGDDQIHQPVDNLPEQREIVEKSPECKSRTLQTQSANAGSPQSATVRTLQLKNHQLEPSTPQPPNPNDNLHENMEGSGGDGAAYELLQKLPAKLAFLGTRTRECAEQVLLARQSGWSEQDIIEYLTTALPQTISNPAGLIIYRLSQLQDKPQEAVSSKRPPRRCIYHRSDYQGICEKCMSELKAGTVEHDIDNWIANGCPEVVKRYSGKAKPLSGESIPRAQEGAYFCEYHGSRHQDERCPQCVEKVEKESWDTELDLRIWLKLGSRSVVEEYSQAHLGNRRERA